MINVALYKILDTGFQAIYLILLVRIALSWIPHNAHHPIISYVYKITDPILRPFQNIVPTGLGIDLSPLLAFLALGFFKNIIFSLLF